MRQIDERLFTPEMSSVLWQFFRPNEVRIGSPLGEAEPCKDPRDIASRASVDMGYLPRDERIPSPRNEVGGRYGGFLCPHALRFSNSHARSVLTLHAAITILTETLESVSFRANDFPRSD